MKKLSLVFVLMSASVLLLSCSSQKVTEKVTEKVQPVEKPVVQQETVKKTDEPKAVVYKDIFDVRDPVIEASSVLKDDTGIGFNYEGKNVIDGDFSTAWCGTKGVGDTISFSFKDPVEAKVIGFLPGFGRDETTYFQNNRIKTLKIYFSIVKDDGSNNRSEWTYNLTDAYSMGFIDLGDQKFKDVKFEILDVYPGSKYKDTCISELDFWSDYVKNKDATAAMNYYNKYKESQALKPKNIIEKVSFSDNGPDECRAPGVNGDHSFPQKDGSTAFSALPVYVSAYVNQFGKEGDLVDVKWYVGILDFEAQDGPVLKSWDLTGEKKGIAVVKDCNGKLYVHAQSKDMGVTGPSMGGYKIEFYSKNELIKTAYFSLSQ